jgi:beta-galactosidase/beta-glucuronidase
MLNNAIYPYYPAFRELVTKEMTYPILTHYHTVLRELVTKEMTYQARRLAHRPSLAVWCGNNEIEDDNLRTHDDWTNYTVMNYGTGM